MLQTPLESMKRPPIEKVVACCLGAGHVAKRRDLAREFGILKGFVLVVGSASMAAAFSLSDRAEMTMTARPNAPQLRENLGAVDIGKPRSNSTMSGLLDIKREFRKTVSPASQE